MEIGKEIEQQIGKEFEKGQDWRILRNEGDLIVCSISIIKVPCKSSTESEICREHIISDLHSLEF